MPHMPHKNLTEAQALFYSQVAVPTCTKGEPVELADLVGMSFTAGALSAYSFLQKALTAKDEESCVCQARALKEEIDRMIDRHLNVDRDTETRQMKDLLFKPAEGSA